MLLSAGLPLYRHLNVHGWINFGGGRMSKSAGNIPDPIEYENKYGPDVLRFFLMREITYGLDSDFSKERLIERYNADLANDLGNLTSRVLSMATRYFNGAVSERPGAGTDALDNLLCKDFAELPDRTGALIEELHFNQALEAIWQALDGANKYVAQTQPFTLARDPARMPRVAQILANLVEALRVVAGVIEPFMPATARRMIEMLAVDEETARAPFGRGIKPGHRVKEPVALFPRIEKAKPK
jgi:methionyl-tRNA synthetase